MRLLVTMTLVQALLCGSAHATGSCAAALQSVLIATATFKVPAPKTGRSVSDLQKEIDHFNGRINDRLRIQEEIDHEMAEPSEGRSSAQLAQLRSENENTIRSLVKLVQHNEAQLKIALEAGEVDPAEAKREALAEIETKVAQTPELGGHVGDLATYAQLRRLPKNQVVSLLISSEEFADTGRDLVAELTRRGYTVLLDGDSKATAAIMSVDGARVFALASTARPDLPAERTFVIGNPYLRLEAFAGRHRVFATADSIIGCALALYDELDGFIGSHTGEVGALKNWREKLTADGWSLGLAKYNAIPIFSGKAGRLVTKKRFPQVNNPAKFKPVQLSAFTIGELKELGDYANRMFAGLKAVTGPQVAIFGSSRMTEKSSRLIYSVAFEFGKYRLGVATGGSGGAMLAANMGAFDGGGESFGIPMGSGLLALEKQTHSEVHTATVEAKDYSERIPWLLHQRRFVVNAPGGGGTMREIATALVWLAQQSPPDAFLIFLQSSYYEPLVEFLKSLPVDSGLRSRIVVIDDVDDLHVLMNGLRRDGLVEADLFARAGEPRGARNQLPEELYSAKRWGTDYSGESSWSRGYGDQDDGPGTDDE